MGACYFKGKCQSMKKLSITIASFFRRQSVILFGCTIILWHGFVNIVSAQEELEEMIVIGNPVNVLNLNEKSETGSRLGLTLFETPASIEIIDSEAMRARGYQRLSEAVESLPGVVSGESPAAPSTFSMRGFTRSQVTILRDGLWVGPANMVMRPQNTFNLERVEVLRGPASVLHGQGVVAGTVNTVNKAPDPQRPQTAKFLGSYGRYDTYQLGLGAGGPLTEELWYRADISQYGSDGYVDRMDPESLNVTASLLWQPTTNLELEFSVDYLSDDLANYWGTPLVPASFATEPLDGVIITTTGETVDERMRFINYNVNDGRAESEQYFLRNDVTWQLADNIELHNTLYYFDADRQWANAEGFIFNPATQLIDRTNGFFFVFHNQELLGNRFDISLSQSLGNMSNHFVAGFEVTDLDFERTRGFRFSPQPGDSVTLLDPVAGNYGPLELRGVSPTKINTRAIFIEDALEISPKISLVAALRYDDLDLTRQNFNAAGALETASFSRDFDWFSSRIGGVYKFTDNVVAYVQYSNAKDPVNANIFLVNSGEDLKLTDAKQWEIGLKAILLDGRAEATITYYDITRDDVLEQIGVDSATNVGGRTANGVEVSGSMIVSQNISIGANAAYTNAEFQDSTNFVTFAGNAPPNVPEWTANFWANYQNVAALPIDIGGALRFVGDRFGDNANTVTLEDYALVDLHASYTINKYRFTARVNNVFDEDYAPWSDVFYLQQTNPAFPYANQILIGSPRTYGVSVEFGF